MNLREIVKNALFEDMPTGDLTTDNLGCDKILGAAKVVAKIDLFLSGTAAFDMTFTELDPSSKVSWSFNDGARVTKGSIICELKAPLSVLLKGERCALNFLGHLSGVATLTAQFVEKTKGTKTKILDTRKTTPGLRDLEKAAVVHGGGKNHRRNLSDQVLIKENHIRAAGGITAACEKIRAATPNVFIEIEVTNPEEINEALKNGANQILLDNMSLEETKNAITQIRNQSLTEASGNMTLDRIESVAKLGVDFISVGQLTHSAPNADLSMLFDDHS